jgi:DNA processing protein
MSLLRFRTPPRILPASDPDYPPGLRALAMPPPIRVAGGLAGGTCLVAVVGTRRADREAEVFTEAFAADLAAAGAVVVSGGARGIDSAAHRGALSVGGVTWAVLATGLDEAYPPENASLFVEIAERGALVSEVFDQVVPRKGRFHSRNRLVAAIADVVVVVQAPERSGALSTARFAERYGKQRYVVPSAPWDPLGEGGLALLERGAKICTKAEDVLSLAGSGPPLRARSPGGSRPKTHENSTLDDVQKAVLGALSSRPRHVDELVRKASLPIEDVQHALLGLILMGLVEDKGSGRFVAATRSPRS